MQLLTQLSAGEITGIITAIAPVIGGAIAMCIRAYGNAKIDSGHTRCPVTNKDLTEMSKKRKKAQAAKKSKKSKNEKAE